MIDSALTVPRSITATHHKNQNRWLIINAIIYAL
jgi:hypothetical protein